MDPSADLRAIGKAHTEALKRIEALSSSLVETFSIFTRRAGLLLVNCSSIRYLFKHIQKASDEDAMQENGDDVNDEDSPIAKAASNARLLLETAAKYCPALFVPYLPELAKTLLEETDNTLLQVALHALSTLAVQDPTAFERDAQVLDRAYNLGLEGTPAQARFAATFVVKVPDNEEQAADLVSVSRAASV
jgi:sister-chromatid-cohesion protein PDS5